MNGQKELEGEFILSKEKKPEEKPATTAVPVGNNGAPTKAGIFSNLLFNPSNVTFENQDDDEHIVLMVRRDLITNAPWIIAAVLLIFIPLIITAASPLFSPFFNLSSGALLTLALFYYIIVFGFILVQFIIWYFNVGIVTKKRLVDLDLHGILSKQLSETKINLIEDVAYSQVGSVRSIFNYGDIHMQTAGTLSNFEFDRAPQPARITKIIAEMIGGKSE